MTDTTDLEIFARVARTGNMSAAGREMSLSPAVVSKRISLLEERLGARLFQRSTRQLSLTDIGEGYFRRVVDILSLVEESEDFIARYNARPSGRLKINAPAAILRRLVMPHLPGFARQYPEVELDFNVSDEPADVIRDGIDVALHLGPPPGDDLEHRHLVDLPRILCAAPSYLDEEGTPAEPQHLRDHTCLGEADEEHWRLVGPKDSHLVRVNGRLRTNCSDLIREAALAGLGIALCPQASVDAELASNRLVRIMPGWQGGEPSALYAVLACREFMPAKVEAFLDFFSGRLASRPAVTPEPERLRISA
ncbi:MAG: LysR family transcriptional regulator [Hyphomicrobiaceae bacterium]